MAVLSKLGGPAIGSNIEIIGGQQLEVVVTFENDEGFEYQMRKSNILSLVIEDTVLEPYIKGALTYKNTYEMFEKNARATPDSNKRTPYYKYSNDGSDRIRIKIKPISNDPNVVFNDRTWSMEYECAIYDVQDIEAPNNEDKIKKVFFWENHWQKFSQSNVEFSTAKIGQVQSKVSPSQMTDDQRSAYTGDAIKELIKAVLGPGEVFDPLLWNRGSSKMFYVSPATNVASVDLFNLWANHTSNDLGGDLNDLCILRNDRHSGNWQLIPIHKIYEMSTDGKNAGSWQLEHFYLQESLISQVPAVKCAPVDFTDPLNKDISLGRFSLIKNYQYVDMAGADNTSQLISRTVHSHDANTGAFSVEKESHSIEAVETFFKNNYVSRLFSKSTKPQPLFKTNDIKKQNVSMEHVYSTRTTPEGRLTKGRNATLRSALFLNSCISFTCEGSTHRQSGKFIAIDRTSGLNDTHFDGKLLGQWFTTSVIHTFSGNAYSNEITAVKIHSTIPTK